MKTLLESRSSDILRKMVVCPQIFCLNSFLKFRSCLKPFLVVSSGKNSQIISFYECFISFIAGNTAQPNLTKKFLPRSLYLIRTNPQAVAKKWNHSFLAFLPKHVWQCMVLHSFGQGLNECMKSGKHALIPV